MNDIVEVVRKAIAFKNASPESLALMLAEELQEQRKQIAELRLLLDHEERVRSEKLHRVTPVKSHSFLRGTVYKKGDRVEWQGRAATVEKVDAGGRVKIAMKSSIATGSRWCKPAELKRTVASVA